MTKKIKLRDAIASDLKKNQYLKQLHQELLRTYALYLFDKEIQFSNQSIQDLLVFADIMSKTKDVKLEQLSLEIVICLNKMYPQSHSIKFYKNQIFEELGNYSRPESDDEYKTIRSVDSLIDSVRQVNEKSLRHFPTGNGYFIGDQQWLYNSISNQLNSFSAPTSMGKSFLMKMFIEEKVKSGEHLNFVYLVPTKALITEVTNDLCDKLGDYINDNNYRIVNHFDSIGVGKLYTNLIYVLTPERFANLLLNNFSGAIDYLFIDEAQNISKEDSRSTVYYRIFDLLRQQGYTPKVTFAAPLIENPEIYETLTSLNKGSALKTNLSPVCQVYFLLDVKGKFEVYDSLTSDFLRISALDFYSNSYYLKNLLHTLPGQKLVYRNSVNNAVNGANYWYRKCDYPINPKLLKLSDYISNQVHPDYYISTIVQKGIAYHFGKVPDEVRNKIEKAFCEGKINTLFCTSTLMEGVNLPADSLIIDNRRIGIKVMRPFQFKNLTGRVGRLSNSMLGNVFIVARSDMDYKKFKELVSSKDMTADLSINNLIDTDVLNAVNADLKAGDLTLQRVRKLTKGQQRFDTVRKFSLIYLNNLQNSNESVVTRHFNTTISSQDRESIKKTFKEKYEDHTEADINFSVDQSIELEKHVKDSDINYPQILDESGELNIFDAYEFLRELGEIYNWSKYEPELAISEENNFVLNDYAELLLRWMKGDNLHQLCDFTIQRRKREKESNFLDRSQNVRDNYGKNNRYGIHKNSLNESNLSIYVLLKALDTIQFKFGNYFLKLSQALLKEQQVDKLENDWYQYLEYGTTDENVIWLEQLGYDRNSALEITNSEIDIISTNELGNKVLLRNRIEELKNSEINNETEHIIKNYPDLFISEAD